MAPAEALHELRSLRQEMTQERPLPAPKETQRLKELEQEASKLKTSLQNMEQKYEGIQLEYRQARSLYESKVATAQEEARRWKTKLEETVHQQRLTADDRLQVEQQASQAVREVETLREEQKHELQDLQERCHKLEEAIRTRDASLDGTAEKVRQAEERQRLLDERLEDQARLLEDQTKLTERAQEELAGWRAENENLSHEIDKLRLLLGDEKIYKDKLEERLRRAEEEKNALRTGLNEAQVRLQSLQGEYKAVCGQLEREKNSAQAMLEELREKASVLGEKNENLERSRLRLVKEIEDAARQADEWKLRAKDFEHAAQDAEQKVEAQAEEARKLALILEERERDLDASRRQVREAIAQLEQRDLIHRRAQLTEQLSMKEERLKALIQEQSQLESEMRHKEEKMRGILAEQERIEKEIVEGKQAQRHHLEQAKREKPTVKIGRPATESKKTSGAQDPSPSFGAGA